MGRILVAYFSASGVTARVASEIASAVGADIFEIVPAQPYTKADLNWLDKKSRSTVEMNDRACRPPMAGMADISAYDVIFVGYPIWWYSLPMALFSFFDEYDFTGKTIIPFDTHFGSGRGGTPEVIAELEPGATVEKNSFAVNQTKAADCWQDVADWLKEIGY